ncbi:fibulin-1 [Astyanax mexicanus]|uniref:fibulin-1 n=1 Tax=Astyanax mexicanus TaxID=7994 RepID=UPI0020CB0872|nr:fibulin-1 [Astyanax mexicanus]
MGNPWITIILTLYGLHRGAFLEPGVASGQTSVEACCRNGRAFGLSNQHCASLPHISHPYPCRVIQEQCCDAAVTDSLCVKGIESARRRGVCERSSFQGDSCKVKTSQMCCECCTLGLLSRRDSGLCELQISVSVSCRSVARACCEGKQHTSLTKETQVFPAPGNKDSTRRTDLCAEGVTRCSQLCVGNGSCVCLKGYHLKSDGYTCEDYNECLAGVHSCRLGERCINTEGSYRCQREASCGTGYELTDSNTCNDIDECLVGTHNCGPGFMCQNTPGSFRCHPKQQCATGFLQDAVGSCIDINECVSENSPCQPGHSCINTVGSYTCQKFTVICGRGYHLNKEGTHCLDVDECSGTHGPCHGHDCVNLLGTFRCECRSGFTFNSISRTCDDTDECRNFPGRLCSHKCENTPGSFYCSCNPGFRLDREGRNCEDVNECESNPCSQECANIYGSYQCYCRRGYQLSNTDGVTCEDIDECALSTGGKVCSYHCFNTPGSFHCTCPPTGYTLSHNGRNCLDIDECTTGTHTCSATQSCFNIQGGFRCLSFECPPNYRRTADRRCERLPCEPNSECVSLPLRISFYNLTFPTNIPTPAAVFRMGPSSSVPGDDVQLALVDGDVEGCFTVQKMAHGGVISLQRPLAQPRDFLLTVEIRLIRYGTVSLFVAKIAVFVVNEHPGLPRSIP